MLKSLFIAVFALAITTASTAKADIGLYYGLGVPYTKQYGITYSSSPKFSMDIGYNTLNLDFDTASVELTKPELNLKYHIWGGATYFGLGIGYVNLEASSTDSGTGQSVTATVKGAAFTPSIGWLWGRANGGLVFGIDIGYQVPMGAEADVDAGGALGPGDPEYDDAQDAAEKFGESALPVITFAKIGYLF